MYGKRPDVGELIRLQPCVASFCLHVTGTTSHGSQIRFAIRGHFVLDKRTGEVGRNAIISTCHVS
jgi:hypothetical protein